MNLFLTLMKICVLIIFVGPSEEYYKNTFINITALTNHVHNTTDFAEKYPYIAFLMRYGEVFCLGILVNFNYVMTIVSCLLSNVPLRECFEVQMIRKIFEEEVIITCISYIVRPKLKVLNYVIVSASFNNGIVVLFKNVIKNKHILKIIPRSPISGTYVCKYLVWTRWDNRAG